MAAPRWVNGGHRVGEKACLIKIASYQMTRDRCRWLGKVLLFPHINVIVIICLISYYYCCNPITLCCSLKSLLWLKEDLQVSKT